MFIVPKMGFKIKKSSKKGEFLVFCASMQYIPHKKGRTQMYVLFCCFTKIRILFFIFTMPCLPTYYKGHTNMHPFIAISSNVAGSPTVSRWRAIYHKKAPHSRCFFWWAEADSNLGAFLQPFTLNGFRALSHHCPT